MSFLQKEGVTDQSGAYAVWADSPFLQRIQKEQLALKVPGLKFDVTRETAASVKTRLKRDGLGGDRHGYPGSGLHRSLTTHGILVPEIRIALIESHRIELNILFLLKKINLETTPYLAFITGPNRTADNERRLTICAHGPERLVIVLVDEASRGR